MAGNFPKSGVEVSVRGAEKFIGDLNRAAGAYDEYTKRLERAKARVASLSASQQQYQQWMNRATTGIKRDIALANEEIAKAREKAAESRKVAQAQRELIKSSQDLIKSEKAKLSALDKTAAKYRDNAEALRKSITATTAKMRDQKGALKPLEIDEKSKEKAVSDIQNLIKRLQAELDRAELKMPIVALRKEAIDKQLGVAQSNLDDILGEAGGGFAKLGQMVGMSEGQLAAFTAIGTKVVSVIAAMGAVIGIAVAGFALLKTAVTQTIGLYTNLANIIRNVVVKAFEALKGVVGGIAKGFGSLISPITNFISRIATIATGIGLYDFLRGVTYGIKGLVTEVFDAVAAFQLLEVRFRTIIANDISQRAMIPFSDAVEVATGKVQTLMDWTKRLAVQSPFTTQDIAEVLALGTAMGMSVEESQRLTVGIGNMTAALGLSDEVMWRIIYNLGQMIQRGRLTGEEFRDLSRNLFPVYEVLERIGAQTGRTGEEMKALALEGGVAVDDFINEFMLLSEEKFPNAMKDLSGTFKVFIQNLRDFMGAFIGQNIFKPVFDRITKSASAMFDKILQSEQFMAATKAMGTGLVKAFEYISPAVDGAVSAVKEFLNALGLIPNFSKGLFQIQEAMVRIAGQDVKFTKFTPTEEFNKFLTGLFTIAAVAKKAWEMITNVFSKAAKAVGSGLSGATTAMKTWGQKMVEALAAGMAAGLKAIVAVIRAINALLAHWLKGRSPPLVAPDIDQWGANTFSEYLNGFTKADFTVFNELSDLIQSYVTAAFSLESKDGEKEAARFVYIIREKLAKALYDIRTGAISAEDAMRGITNTLPGLNAEFLRFANNLFKVAQAQGLLDEAARQTKIIQAELNIISAKYEKILDKLNKRLEELTDKFEDENRLAKINKSLTYQRLTVAERRKLEVEKESILLEQQIRDVENMRDVESAALKEKLDFYKQQEEAARAIVEALQDELDVSKMVIEAQIKQLELLKQMQTATDKLAGAAEKLGGAAGAMKEAAEDVSTAFGGISLDDEEIFDFDWDKIIEDAEKSAQTIVDNFAKTFEPITSLFQGEEGAPSLFDTVLTEVDNLKTNIQGIFDAWNDPANTSKIGTFFDLVKTEIDEVKQWFKDTFGDMFGTITLNEEGKPILDLGNLDTMIADFISGIDDLVAALDPLVYVLQESLGLLKQFTGEATAGKSAVDILGFGLSALAVKISLPLVKQLAWAKALGTFIGVFRNVQKSLDEFTSKIKKAWDEVGRLWNKLKEASSIGGGTFEGLKSRVKALLDFVIGVFSAIMTSIAGVISGIFLVVTSGFSAVAQAIWAWISTWLGYFETFKYQLIGDPIVIDLLKGIYDAFFEWMGKVSGTVLEKLGEIEGWFSQKLSAVLSWVKDNFITPMENFLRDLFTVKIPEFLETARGKIKEIETAWGAVKDWIKASFIDPIIEWFDDTFKVKIPEAMEKVKEKIEAFKTKLSELGSYIKGEFASAVKTVIDTVLTPLKAAFDAVATAAERIWNALKNIPLNILNALTGGFGGTSGISGQSASGIPATASPGASPLGSSGTSSVGQQVFGSVGAVGGGTLGAGVGPQSMLMGSGGAALGGGAGQMFGGIVGSLGMFAQVFEQLSNAVTAAVSVITIGISAVSTTIQSKLGATISWIATSFKQPFIDSFQDSMSNARQAVEESTAIINENMVTTFTETLLFVTEGFLLPIEDGFRILFTEKIPEDFEIAKDAIEVLKDEFKLLESLLANKVFRTLKNIVEMIGNLAMAAKSAAVAIIKMAIALSMLQSKDITIKTTYITTHHYYYYYHYSTSGQPPPGRPTPGGASGIGNDYAIGDQTGGTMLPGNAYLVGEVRPEVVIPTMGARVIPSVQRFMNMVKAGFYGGSQMAMMPSVYNIDNSVTINVDANYAKSQSLSGIRHDVSAALAASRM